MKHTILSLVFFFSFLTATLAQKIYFPAANYKDSVTLDRSIKEIAKTIQPLYKEDDRLRYLNRKLLISIAAEDYNAVPSQITDIAWQQYGDTVTTKAKAFPERAYAITMTANPENYKDFTKVYIQVFARQFDRLDDDNKNWAGEYFTGIAADRYATGYRNTITRLKDSDSLSVADAAELVYAVTENKVYQLSSVPASLLLTKLEAERYIIQDSIGVKMPNGATLTVTVVRSRKNPAAGPVSLSYNIYAGNELQAAKEAVFRGYIGVVANPRGKRTSPQEMVPFEKDGDDAYYLIDWISKQPWCNGKVGMYGGSYLGFAQWSAMKKVHPALKTIVPQVSVGAGIDYPYFNGIFMTYGLRWIHYVTDNKLSNNAVFADEKKWGEVYSNWFKGGKSMRALDSTEGQPNKIFQRWMDHPLYDAYWKNTTPDAEQYAAINIPILTTTGYWDDDQLGAQWYYKQYHRYNRNPNYYLLIGPYDHGGSQYIPRNNLLGYKIDDAAKISIIDLVYKWFDYVMKDSSKPAILKDKVNFEVAGANEWRHVSRLQDMTNDTMRLYIGKKVSENEYELSTDKPMANEFVQQETDLRNKTGGHHANGDVGAFTMLLADSMLYTKGKIIMRTAPLEKDMILSGSLTAMMKAAVNKKDMDLDIVLYEQMADGKYLALNEILQRASLAENRSERKLLQPDKETMIPVRNSYIVSRKLQKGSRLVILLGINHNDAWEVNYGSGKPVNEETVADAGLPMMVKWFKESCFLVPLLR